MNYFRNSVYPQGGKKGTLPALCSLIALSVNALRECILQTRVDCCESHWLLVNFTTRIPILGQKEKPCIRSCSQVMKNVSPLPITNHMLNYPEQCCIFILVSMSKHFILLTFTTRRLLSPALSICEVACAFVYLQRALTWAFTFILLHS